MRLVWDYADEDEEIPSQNATLLYNVGDRDGLREINALSNLATLILLQLNDHVLPQSSSTHCVECYCQINERDIKLLILLQTILL